MQASGILQCCGMLSLCSTFRMKFWKIMKVGMVMIQCTCILLIENNGIVLATFQARLVPKKNSFNPQFRWTFFLKHFQLDQTNPHSFRLQFKSFCLPHVHVWTLNNRTLFYRESRSVTSVSPNQHRKHFPAVQSEMLLLNLFTVLSGLNIFSSKPTSILH